MGQKIVYIYSISDPDTLEIRYIGQTMDTDTRWRKHLTERDISDKYDWIQSLIKQNKKPIFTIIDHFQYRSPAYNNSKEKMQAIIAFENGNRLFNSDKLYKITEQKIGVHTYVTPAVKKKILEQCILEQRSESFIVSKLLNKIYDPIEEKNR